MSDKYDIGRIIALETAYRDLKSRVEQLEKAAASRFAPPSVAEPSWRDNYPAFSDHTVCHSFATGPLSPKQDDSEIIGAPV